MTYEGLAQRMTDLGCSIQPSAIYKIEKSNPPRRITVDELVAFSQVFGIPVEQLLLPVEIAESEALLELLVTWQTANTRVQQAKEEEGAALEAVKKWAAGRSKQQPILQRFVRNWVETWSKEPDFSEAYWMHTFTGAPEWTAKAVDHMDELATAVESRSAAQKKTAHSG